MEHTTVELNPMYEGILDQIRESLGQTTDLNTLRPEMRQMYGLLLQLMVYQVSYFVAVGRDPNDFIESLFADFELTADKMFSDGE